MKAFVKEPWRRYNEGEADLMHHNSLEYHKFAVTKAGEFSQQFSSSRKTVIQLIDKQRNQTIESNRRRLVPIFQTVLLCGRLNLVFRGHTDYGDFSTTQAQESSLAGFQGIFRGLLAFRMQAGDTVLQEHFASGA